MRGRWVGLSMLALLGLMGTARGQTCVVASSGLAFGTYDPFAASPASITGTVTVTCQALVSVGLSYSIQLGTGGGGTFGGRSLSAGSGRLGYQLYTSAARSVVWGDGSGGTGVVSDGFLLTAVSPTIRTYTIYGAITARQIAPPGSYTDVATVTVLY